MRVIIIDHARDRMVERGAKEDEVIAVLKQGRALKRALGREVKEMIFPFNSRWQGRFYGQKKVRVVYIEEGDNQIVITVYAYFGEWEGER